MKIRLLLILCCLWWAVPGQLLALTVEEILKLKQNGVSEETIQMMLQSEMRAQAQQDGTVDETMGIQTITRSGGQSAIVYSTGSADPYAHDAEERSKEQQAWEMLRNIILDTQVIDDRGLRKAD